MDAFATLPFLSSVHPMLPFPVDLGAHKTNRLANTLPKVLICNPLCGRLDNSFVENLASRGDIGRGRRGGGGGEGACVRERESLRPKN